MVVDPAAFGVIDPSSTTIVGRDNPFGRSRIVSALPLNPGPALVSPPTVLHDPGPAYLADPDNNLIGTPAVWVSRMLTAIPTADTRRLG